MSNEELTSVIIQALNKTHSHSSTHEERFQAQKILEDAKLSDKAITLGPELFLQQKTDVVRYFGLELLESAVKLHWNQYNAEKRTQFKSFILQYIANNVGLQNEVQFLKTKFVRLLVEISIREWPQQWPELFPSLLSLSRQHEMKNEIILLFFMTIGEELSSDKLPRKRRDDVQSGLRNEMINIFTVCCTTLQQYIPLYISNSDKKSIAKSLIQNSLSSFISYVDWCPHSILFQHNLGEMLCKLLAFTDFRLQACECLMIILGRKGKPEELYELLFPFLYLNDIIPTIKVESDEDDYTYNKHITQIMTLMGVQYIGNFEFAKEMKNFKIYLQLMLNFMEHNSLLLNYYSVSFWCSLLANSQILNSNPEIKELAEKQIIPRLTLLSFKKLRKVKFPTDDEDEKKTAEEKQIEQYIEFDFSVKSEFDDFFSNFLNEIGKLIGSIAKYRSTIGFELIFSLQLSNEITPIVAQFLSFYVRSIEKDSFQDANLIQMINSFIKKAIDLAVGNPTQLRMKLDLFLSLLPYFQANFDACVNFFQYILTLVEQMINVEFTSTKEEEVSDFMAVKRKLFGLLSKFTKTSSHFLIGKYQDYMQAINRMLSNEKLREAEKTILFEVLVCFSKGFGKRESQASFLNQICGKYVGQLLADPFQSAISSPSSFLQFISSSPPSNPILNIDLINDNIFSLFSILTNCKIPDSDEDRIKGGYKVGEKISYPTEEILKQILPSLFTLLSSLSSLSNPSFALPPQFLYLRDLDENIKVDLLRQSKIIAPSPPKTSERKIQLRVTDIRTYSYRLIALCTIELSPDIFANAAILQSLKQSVFDNIPFINYYQLKLLFRNLIFPIFKITPPIYFHDIYQSLFSTINHRLTADWQTLINNRNSDQNNNNNKQSNYDEIIFENIVIEFSREFLENLNILISNCSEEDKKNDILVSEIGKYFCSHSSIFEEFILLLMSCSSFPDSTLKNSSTLILSHILPFICKIGEYEGMITGKLFPKLLQNITTSSESSYIDGQINLIAIIFGDEKLRTSPNFVNFLSQIPNSSPAILNQFYEVNKDAHRKIVKRNLKELLKEVIGVHTVQKSSKNSSVVIANHIDKVFVKSLKKSLKKSHPPNYDLASIFQEN